MTRPPPRASATAVAAPSLDADPVTSADTFRRTSSSLPPEFVEQRFCLFEIRCVEAFGEPAEDGGEQGVGFGVASLVAAEPGEARDGAQFPELGPLLHCDAQRFAIEFLGGLGMPLPQQQLAFAPVQLGCEPALPVLSTICKASSNRVKASSTCPAVSHAPARRAI